MSKERNVLVIADTHFPFVKEGYLAHCRKIQKEYNCSKVIHIGDEVDLCASSDFPKDPDGKSAGDEYWDALEMMKIWYSSFPEVSVCIGNHSSRIFRLAKKTGITKYAIKTYEQLWDAPKGWKWAESWEIDDVHYTHGTGLSGPSAGIKLAKQYRQNVVVGHVHSEAGIQYSASKKDLIWALMVGGAINDSSYAAAYAKDQIKKSIIGCGVVVQGKLPLFIPMLLI